MASDVKEDFPTVTIPSFGYTAGTTDIGSGYAAGIAQAGKGIAQGVSQIFDVANRSRNADDTLQALAQNKILTPEQYQSVAGKSLGAKESLLGMYAGEWIKNQAQERELQKIGVQGAVQHQVAHAQLLDTINAMKSGSGAAVGIKPGEQPLQPNQPRQGQPQNQQQNQPPPLPKTNIPLAPGAQFGHMVGPNGEQIPGIMINGQFRRIPQ